MMAANENVSNSDTKKTAPVLEHQSGRMENGLPTNFSALILQNNQEDCQV